MAGEATATGAPAPEARVEETTEAAVQVGPDAEGGEAEPGPEVMRLRATVAQQLALGLAIAQLSDEEKAAEGDKFLRARLAELTRAAAGALM